MKIRHFLGALLTIGTFALGRTALADPQPTPLFADAELLSVTAQRCHDAVKNALVQGNVVGNVQDSDGFQFGINSSVSAAVWCLPHFQNPGDMWLVIAISSTEVGAAQNARDDIRNQVKSWLANPLNQ
jgi:hypothetical protein